jgi:hypothetical protein
MQCLDDLPIPSKTSLNSKTFNARLTRSLIPARSCGAVRKISNCRSKTRARCCYITYRSGCSKRSQSGVRRKVGNVPTISVPGFDQFQTLRSVAPLRPLVEPNTQYQSVILSERPPMPMVMIDIAPVQLPAIQFTPADASSRSGTPVVFWNYRSAQAWTHAKLSVNAARPAGPGHSPFPRCAHEWHAPLRRARRSAWFPSSWLPSTAVGRPWPLSARP